MLKKLIVLTMVLALAAFAAAVPNILPAPKGVEMVSVPLVASEENEAGVILYTSGNVFQETAGYQGGITTYDYQSNGAMGNRIAVDPDGDAHICWMHSDEDNPAFPDRDIYYNVWKKSTGEFIWPSGVKASGTGKAGYTTIALLSDSVAVVAYHHDPDGDGVYQSAVSIDAFSEGGAFSAPIDIDPVTVPEQPIWPRIVIGPDDVIHVTAHVHVGTGDTPYNYYYLYYSRSTDGGQTFSEWEVISEQAGSDAALAVSEDGKVAISWVAGLPIKGTTNKFASHGNVYYVESTNSGASWSSPVEITAGIYAEEQPNTSDTVTLAALTNTLDCAYDASGNLHIAFGETWRSAYENPDDNFRVWFSYFPPYFQRLMHWSEVTNDTICASGKYTQVPPVDENGDTIEMFNRGYWGNALATWVTPGLGLWNPQLSMMENGNVVYTWVGQWDTLDVTGAGTQNADLYATVSTDGGATWGPGSDWSIQGFNPTNTCLGVLPSERIKEVTPFINLTNTASPNAKIGESLSEEYHSACPWIYDDEILHITYNHDLFAGSCVGDPTLNIMTDNPVKYLPVKVGGAIQTQLDKDLASDVDETPSAGVPTIEVFGQQPITNSVAFSVSVPGSHASLKIYDAAGNLVNTVFEGDLNGTRVLTWDASAVSSGVYFYYFTTPARIENGRVVVVH